MRSKEFVGHTKSLDQMKQFAKMHYGDPNELRALLTLLARSSMHGFEDDKEQYQMISNLSREVQALKKKINTPQSSKEIMSEASYDGMVNNLRATYPDSVPFINNQLKWAKKTFRKDEKVVWWLRLATAYLKNSITSEELGHIADNVGHFFGFNIPQIDDYQFGRNDPEKVTTDLQTIYNQWEQDQEDKNVQRAPVYPEANDYKLIDFGNGTAWWFVDRAYCEKEGHSGAHCGNVTGRYKPDQRILSFRTGGSDDHAGNVKLTFILEPDGKLGEMKAYNNQKPSVKLHPYIMALLLNPIVKGIAGGGYLADNNFSVFDLSDKDIAILEKQKPELIMDQIAISPAQALKAPPQIRQQYYDDIMKVNGMQYILNPDGTMNESEEAWSKAIYDNMTLSLYVPPNLIDTFKPDIIRTLQYYPETAVTRASREIRRDYSILKEFVKYDRKNIIYVQPTTPNFDKLCYDAVLSDGDAIEYIPSAFRTPEMMKMAFRDTIAYTDDETLAKLTTEVKELLYAPIDEMVSDTEQNDDYYYNAMAEKYGDEDGDIDWNALEDEDYYSNWNDELRRWIRDIQDAIDPSVSRIRELANEMAEETESFAQLPTVGEDREEYFYWLTKNFEDIISENIKEEMGDEGHSIRSYIQNHIRIVQDNGVWKAKYVS